jgi:hypothetical protein
MMSVTRLPIDRSTRSERKMQENRVPRKLAEVVSGLRPKKFSSLVCRSM